MKDFTLQQYRDLGSILSDSFGYVRIHFRTLGKALLFLVLPFYLISGMIVGNAYTSFFSALMNNPDVSGDVMLGGDFWIGVLLLAMSSGALLTVTLTHIQMVYGGEEVVFSKILDRFGKNFFVLFLLYLLIIFAVSFSFLLLIIPGIYVGIKLFVAPAVAILEDKNPVDAIIRSWNLVQGHWWFTCSVYLVMNIITSFMSYVLIIPMTIILGFFAASGAGSSEMIGTGMGIMYGLIVVIGSLFSVLILIAMCLQYFNLVERKEGKGLRAQIEELG